MSFRLYDPDELGADGYPPEWHATVKHEVRRLAGDRCVRCGHPYQRGQHGRGEWSPCDEHCTHDGPCRWIHEGVAYACVGPAEHSAHGLAWPSTLEAQWRILTVHHLDGNKANCRWWNLTALCQRCHLTIQGRVRMERTWPWEHTEWFKPYVAGFYAWSYLGEDLTREETEARLDELLALERVEATHG